MLVIDEAEYMEMFKLGKETKTDREAYILDRLNIGLDEEDDKEKSQPEL